MKRRTFSLLAGVSLPALKFGYAKAQTMRDPSLLTTTLTPVGAERAGNAAGTIPAWTGGLTTVPPGWQPGTYMPDFFADEQPVTTIDASNMAQYADKLSDGVMAMMTKYGYKLKVYSTHRTAAAPQWVYDNIAKNCTTAKLNPKGGRLGFSNAYGGIPFPIPDVSDPLAAGAEIMWNHEERWQGQANSYDQQAWVVSGGTPVFASRVLTTNLFPYYDPTGSLSTYAGVSDKQHGKVLGPANSIGGQLGTWFYSNPYLHETESWVLLSGQNRVRRAPELEFDTPSPYADGLINYDESTAFAGSMEQYDWKFIAKKEMYIPYNNNGLFAASPQTVLGPHYMNPDVVRWELHRVWVVEATLHPGYRNTLARRRFYVDEDNWNVAVVDAWDANNNLYHVHHTFNYVRPDVPGTMMFEEVVYNMQTDDYTVPGGLFDQKSRGTLNFYNSLPASAFDPEHMAAASEY